MKYVLERTDVRQLPTATTRPIRSGEVQGREHDFVPLTEFQHMVETGELLEHQVIHGNLYGMPRKAVEHAIKSGQSIIADIEYLGAARARAIYPNNAVSVFIQTPSIGTLIERMYDRNEATAEIAKRLLRVPKELDYARECNYRILNDSFQHAADLLYRIVESEINGERGTVESDALVVYRYRYEAQIIPVYHGELLRRTEPPFEPAEPIKTGEMPHVAGLRYLHDQLGLAVNASALIAGDKPDGDYLPPLRLRYGHDNQGELVTYVYLYCLNQRIEPPPGWSWLSISGAELPETFADALAEYQP